MLTISNSRKLFFALLITLALPLDSVYGDRTSLKRKGTQVNVGGHVIFQNNRTVVMIVLLTNTLKVPLTVKSIKIFKPDGTEESPDFQAAGFPTPPFTLEPFPSLSLNFDDIGIEPIPYSSPTTVGQFQVHTQWESKKPSPGLEGNTIMVGVEPGQGVVSRNDVDGYDLP